MTTAIGVPYPRLDSEPKVAGSTRYAGDLYEPGLLHARLVLSPFAHAQIQGVEREAALALPGVVAVLTAADLPTADRSGLRQQEPLAREEVLFAGQPVAIVVAESEAAAQDGVDAVVVEYEPLEAVLTIEQAMRKRSFVLPPRTVRRGDPEKALANPPATISGPSPLWGRHHHAITPARM